MKDYILYIAQEANFQTRSLLIPAKEFLSIPDRKKDYDILKKNGNLLIHNLVSSKTGGFQFELTEYTQICGYLSRYADGIDYYINPADDIWYDISIGGFCSGFNHIKNYNQFKNATNIKGKDVNIIDSFLVLETEDGKFNPSQFDTVNEMMLYYYK